MTEKTFFERLYLIPGLGTFGPGVNCAFGATLTHRSLKNYFSINVKEISQSNLAESLNFTRLGPLPWQRWFHSLRYSGNGMGIGE